MLALIDSDILLYEVGFTTEDLDEPIAFARMDERVQNIVSAVGAEDYICYLSDSKENNFRYKIDCEYKAHRVQPKPKHYDVLKEYLLVEHGAKIAHGMEADDALGINQDKERWLSSTKPTAQGYEHTYHYNTIICTIDKDLNQIPGLHYSWPINRGGIEVRPGKIYEVTKFEGLKYFYKQLLIGDVADNIKGIDGIGPKKADKLIDPCTTEEQIQDEVKLLYSLCYKEGEWRERLNKNVQLLWILREEDGKFEFPPSAFSKWAEKQT